MILTVVLPAALPGIVSGSLLAIARAAGETAPLMFAVGAATAMNPHFFSDANTALSVQISHSPQTARGRRGDGERVRDGRSARCFVCGCVA